jgi:hypothetical protein
VAVHIVLEAGGSVEDPTVPAETQYRASGPVHGLSGRSVFGFEGGPPHVTRQQSDFGMR